MKYEIIKGSEKDFEQAPEWAMQVESLIDSNTLFYTEAIIGSQTAKHLCQWSDESISRPLAHSANSIGGGFTVIAQRRPITESVVNQQLTTEWSGEGLPPVGVECEFSSCSLPDSWHSGIVRYISEHTVVIEFTDMINGNAESISHPRATKFRPIRSPEGVARDEEIVLLTDVIFGKMPDAGMAAAAMFADAVYDAGYRRTKPHADEVQACEHKSTRTSAGGCICNDCGWRSW